MPHAGRGIRTPTSSGPVQPCCARSESLVRWVAAPATDPIRPGRLEPRRVTERKGGHPALPGRFLVKTDLVVGPSSPARLERRPLPSARAVRRPVFVGLVTERLARALARVRTTDAWRRVTPALQEPPPATPPHPEAARQRRRAGVCQKGQAARWAHRAPHRAPRPREATAAAGPWEATAAAGMRQATPVAGMREAPVRTARPVAVRAGQPRAERAAAVRPDARAANGTSAVAARAALLLLGPAVPAQAWLALRAQAVVLGHALARWFPSDRSASIATKHRDRMLPTGTPGRTKR
jgi:hypothetical protein